MKPNHGLAPGHVEGRRLTTTGLDHLIILVRQRLAVIDKRATGNHSVTAIPYPWSASLLTIIFPGRREDLDSQGILKYTVIVG